MDKVCAVFGGSRGIGRAVAQLMAQKGYRLAIVARNLEVAKAAAGELGENHLAFSCDVSKEQDVQNTFEEMEKRLGPVNFLVNAAGINRDGLLVRTKTEDMISQLHINLLGSMLTCKAAMRTMIQQGGSIVNVGSVIGLKGNVGQSVYSASKGGLVGFSRSLAKEVARKKIRVNVVAPDSRVLKRIDRAGFRLFTEELSFIFGPEVEACSFSSSTRKQRQDICYVSCEKVIQPPNGCDPKVENYFLKPIVDPGFIHTDMTKHLKEDHLKKSIPLGRFGETLEVAHAVVFLLESPYITGHVLVVDGGLQLTI